MNCFEVIQGKSRQYLTQADTQTFVEHLLKGTDPRLGNHNASHWNDAMGLNFEEIAELIEEHL